MALTFLAGQNATPPANSVVASDDAGVAGHVQLVKLAISTDASATKIPADAANGLDVDVTRIRNIQTPNGDSMVDEVNDALKSTIVTVVTIQGETYLSKEFHFTAAQTDQALITVNSSQKLRVGYAAAVCDAANSVNVGVRLGFATATLSAPSSSGVDEIILSHPGIAPGSGFSIPIGVVREGPTDADLRLTCTVPTGGSVRVIVYYKII